MRKYFKVSDDFFSIMQSYLPTIKSYKHISTGWTNFVFIAKAKNGKFVFRFPRNHFFSEALEKECQFLAEFNNSFPDAKVPQIKLLNFKGRPFSVYPYINGKPLSQCKLSKRNKKRLAEDVLCFLNQLGQFSPTMKLERTSQFLRRLAKVSGEGDYDLKKHLALIKAEGRGLVLTHGDLNPGNILISKGRVVCIFDFAFVSYSSKLDDIARLTGRLGEDYFDYFAKQFKSVYGTDLSRKQIDDLISVWDYVEQKYVQYIKAKHPDIVLPSKFS